MPLHGWQCSKFLKPMRDWKRITLGARPIGARYLICCLRKVSPKWLFAELLPAYNQAAAQHMTRIIVDYPVEQCPGAHALVTELHRRGHPLQGLVTGNTASIAPIKLRAGGFDPDWFVVGAYGSESPDRNDLPPLAVDRAEKLTGRKIAPEQVIVIGDTPADIACARALGAVAVGLRQVTPLPWTELVEVKSGLSP